MNPFAAGLCAPCPGKEENLDVEEWNYRVRQQVTALAKSYYDDETYLAGDSPILTARQNMAARGCAALIFEGQCAFYRHVRDRRAPNGYLIVSDIVAE
jgi:hypothetical protein